MRRSTNGRRDPESPAQPGFASRIPRPAPRVDAAMRLVRLKRLAWFLDRSIPIGRWRIGVDPILGLLPGAGDWLGALLSLYVFYEGARLGMPRPVLARMAGNILVETIVGAIPVLGDLFDFAWQANTRNMQLIERHYRPELRSRPLGRIWVGAVVFALLVLVLLFGLLYLAFRGLEALLS